jgi:hypothetical protein
MFNLITRRTDRIRVRATLKSHQRSLKSLGVLWIRRSKVRILPRQPVTLRVAVRETPHTTSGGFVREEGAAGSNKEPRNAPKFT